MTIEEAIPFLIPLAILQLTLVAIGLWDLTRPDRRVRGGNKVVWGVVIVALQMLGPPAYFLFGRDET
jgi:Phospholipase_D-nuclease N-terminal